MVEVNSTIEYRAILRRRRRPLLVTATVIALATIGLAFGLPPVYRSSGSILVEQQEIPLDFVRSTVTSYADQRIQVINQRVISRANLTNVILDHDLVEDDADDVAMDLAVSEMRESMLMEMIDARVVNERTGNISSATIAFTVSYDNEDPLTARNVTRDLMDLYLSQNLLERVTSASDTANFLNQEIDNLSNELAEAETALARFKQENADSLPTRRDLNLQYIDRADRELSSLDREIRELRQARNLLDVEISQAPPVVFTVFDESGEVIQSATARLQEAQAEYMRMSSIYSSEHPDLVSLRKEIQVLTGGDTSSTIAQLELSVEQRRAELDLAEQRYSEEHPDVLRIRRSLLNLESELDMARALSPGGTPEPNNPVYIALKVRLDATQNEIDALNGRRSELLADISTYETRLALTPDVERELLTLTREYDLARDRYSEVREQQREARLSETLEAESKGERFTILDSPRVPVQPISPNRPAMIVLGLILAIAGGVGLAAMAEALDGSVRGSQDVREVFEAPPLAVIPYVDNDGDVKHRRTRKLVYGAVAALALLGVIMVV